MNFIKFHKKSNQKDGLTLYLYGVIKASENKMGYTMVAVKQLLDFADLGRSSLYKIKKALMDLEKENAIEVFDGIDFKSKREIENAKANDMLFIKSKDLVNEGEAFIIVEIDEILKFMQQQMKGTKGDIFKQFVYLIGFINQGKQYRKISFPSIETIVQDTGVSDRTVKNYTRTLEDQGLLYSNNLILEKEYVKKIYSRSAHSQDVEDAIEECIAKNTKKINNKKGFEGEGGSSQLQAEKEFKSTLKQPELTLEVDKQIQVTFANYQGELNDQSLFTLKQFQKQHGVEVLLKAIHVTMDGKNGLKNPTGFILKQLKDRNVIEDAECQIRHAKENLERMQREDSKKQYFDYTKGLKRRPTKKIRNSNDSVEMLFPELLQQEEKQTREKWMDTLRV
ncbi:Helix-turn-helix domain-containing protein [Priestia megaterium]|nr:Helix-turn-helix domain-containing protein [Priestia megaterium]